MFTSSIERFHEFAIPCFLLHDSVPEAQVTAAWSEVKNQSERQLGAFIFLWLSEFEEKHLSHATERTHPRPDSGAATRQGYRAGASHTHGDR
jgi:hypothetical protein